ncbi:MAG: UDP-N-acetylmuramoyl-L-alanyl-D-glutamate--2,6-diaminopimelate ligase [Candidatus Eremiobacteraeota bacterium]|nr:UDP-N-acetylmuramoyl-L-alanyl-D-glutamate--2,6-diaminopimelate ligase [Candidatus Eremiobacteraeota bacterium]
MTGSPSKPLREFIGDVPSANIRGELDVAINSLEIDSRKVREGSLFVALRGAHFDGHSFIDTAIAAGARAVVMETEGSVPDSVTRIVVRDSARALSLLAHSFYGRPSERLTAIGITGTNGKTTTAHLIAAIMNEGGIPTGILGTLGADFSHRHWDLENTTPLAHELHSTLAAMEQHGARAVAMEVSSHALALQRVEDVNFQIAVLTNVTRDHLDFHGTFAAYVHAKRRLFERAPTLILNADDATGLQWWREGAPGKTVLTYGLHPSADVRVKNLEESGWYSEFTIDAQSFRIDLPGRFNVENAAAAIAVARSLGTPDAVSARALRRKPAVRGRMERMQQGDISVIVDYAHTPDALANALRALRRTTDGRLFVVFGCGGDRDPGKRPQMGRIAAEYADRVFVTSDNPRTEDPQKIVKEILAGMPAQAIGVASINRREAIRTAIEAAQAGDVVLIAGKGHEKQQILGRRAHHFDDVDEARDALERKQRA